MKIKEVLAEAISSLQIQSTSPRLDAEVLLAYVLCANRGFLYAHPDFIIKKMQLNTFRSLIKKRQAGIPVAYLTGVREFWSLSLLVGEDTLIPRPETELLVELVLNLFPAPATINMLDLGTGSGAIALACAAERPLWHIVGVDKSHAALLIAEENAAKHNLTNVNFYQSDWFEQLPEQLQFDVIVANPPYIELKNYHILSKEVLNEPKAALISKDKGLAALKYIAKHAIFRLKPGGLLLLEHGFKQKFSVRSMLKHYGYVEIQSWQDWQGKTRVSGGRRIIS